MTTENETMNITNTLLARVEAEKNRADELANMIRILLQEFSATKTLKRETFEFADFMLTMHDKGTGEEE